MLLTASLTDVEWAFYRNYINLIIIFIYLTAKLVRFGHPSLKLTLPPLLKIIIGETLEAVT